MTRGDESNVRRDEWTGPEPADRGGASNPSSPVVTVSVASWYLRSMSVLAVDSLPETGLAARAARGRSAFSSIAAERWRCSARAAVRRAVDALDPRLREAFLLKYVEEMDYHEMSAALGASVSALKMRVKRACDDGDPNT